MAFGQRNHEAIIVFVHCLFSPGCTNPGARRERLEARGSECLIVGDEIEEARECLARKGVECFGGYGGPESFQSCGAYWGYPLVASCSGIIFAVENGKLIEYKVWGETDGLWQPLASGPCSFPVARREGLLCYALPVRGVGVIKTE